MILEVVSTWSICHGLTRHWKVTVPSTYLGYEYPLVYELPLLRWNSAEACVHHCFLAFAHWTKLWACFESFLKCSFSCYSFWEKPNSTTWAKCPLSLSKSPIPYFLAYINLILNKLVDTYLKIKYKLHELITGSISLFVV